MVMKPSGAFSLLVGAILLATPGSARAQRLGAQFPTVTYDLSSLPAVGGARAASQCDLSSSLGARAGEGALTGAAVGALVYELYFFSASLLSMGATQSYGKSVVFIGGGALVGAVWKGFVAPRLCASP